MTNCEQRSVRRHSGARIKKTTDRDDEQIDKADEVDCCGHRDVKWSSIVDSVSSGIGDDSRGIC